MDSIELSSILDCFGDQNTIKSTKTYTIWLEMIAKVLNMLIELKSNNYYLKVFKRVNYKLSNNTFLVVIMLHWNDDMEVYAPKTTPSKNHDNIIKYEPAWMTQERLH